MLDVAHTCLLTQIVSKHSFGIHRVDTNIILATKIRNIQFLRYLKWKVRVLREFWQWESNFKVARANVLLIDEYSTLLYDPTNANNNFFALKNLNLMEIFEYVEKRTKKTNFYILPKMINHNFKLQRLQTRRSWKKAKKSLKKISSKPRICKKIRHNSSKWFIILK